MTSAQQQETTEPAQTTEDTHHEVIIVGAGLSGIAAAASLRENGIDDFLIIERRSGIGGTWHQNTYPGCECDVPSHLYSYEWAPNPDWSRLFAPQDEIRRYIEDVAAKHGVTRRIRFDTTLESARWDEEGQRWEIATDRGSLTCHHLISAVGSIQEPNVDAIKGLKDFKGRTFHSSAWPDGYTGAGERVAVIGTGASSIQITPSLQPHVEHLTVFQRTPSWINPKPNPRIPKMVRRLFRQVPLTYRIMRGALLMGAESVVLSLSHPWMARLFSIPTRLYLRSAVKDPELRRVLTPDYLLGCKRALISSKFYPALQQPNVRLVPRAVARVDATGVIDVDGEHHEVDTIVVATGFHFGNATISDRVIGRAGKTLDELWDGVPSAYRGTIVSGFPNFALLWGPNSGTGSAFAIAEAQMTYV
ncbi:MAG TPA: NAD(P)/FAD-dependent oxidoreductase, partial [Solirubrobacterales bacterium]|nr:NAD(P)/FAD-dependent oxidoreductase [Solirubrobacterales bacterium]